MSQRGQSAVPVAAGCAGVVGLILLVTLGGFALGWFDTILGVASGQSVKQTYAVAYDNYHALDAAARNVCDAQQVVVSAVPGEERQQRTTQLIAQENNYHRIAGEYDAAYADGFRAKHVGPNDLPKVAPTLPEMLTQVGCAPK